MKVFVAFSVCVGFSSALQASFMSVGMGFPTRGSNSKPKLPQRVKPVDMVVDDENVAGSKQHTVPNMGSMPSKQAAFSVNPWLGLMHLFETLRFCCCGDENADDTDGDHGVHDDGHIFFDGGKVQRVSNEEFNML